MIPKTIHYCWFGGKKIPEEAEKCIQSWIKYFPDYEIKQWNESNFDFSFCDYAKEAYQEKKWAFVSDYARFLILYKEGGIYFDTDVEVIKLMNTIIEKGPFLGVEYSGGVAPGLGMGAEPGMKIYSELLEIYENSHFVDLEGKSIKKTVVDYTTEVLNRYGYHKSDEIQKVAGIYIYPERFFCPKNYETGEITITDDTYTIHHYAATWHSRLEKIIYEIEKCDKRNKKFEYSIRRVISFPFRAIYKIRCILG